MKSLVYPSDRFIDECEAAIQSKDQVSVQVPLGSKFRPMQRYMARITRAPNQPSLLISVMDNLRIADFAAGIADALIGGWKFSYAVDERGLAILIQPPT
jgi:hypothetical protein